MWHLCESLISCLCLLGCSTSHTQMQGEFFVAIIAVALFLAPFERGSEILTHSELTLQPISGGFKQLFFSPFSQTFLTFINQPTSSIFSLFQWHDYPNLLVLESDSLTRSHLPHLCSPLVFYRLLHLSSTHSS